MEAEFCSLNRKIHFIEVRYIKIWVNLPPPKQNYRILNKEGTFYNIKVCKLFVFLITPLFTSVRFSFGLKFFFLNQWNQTYSFNQIVLTILLVAVLYALRIYTVYLIFMLLIHCFLMQMTSFMSYFGHLIGWNTTQVLYWTNVLWRSNKGYILISWEVMPPCFGPIRFKTILSFITLNNSPPGKGVLTTFWPIIYIYIFFFWCQSNLDQT